MKLQNFIPTFRNVLLEEHREDVTSGGIYLAPSTECLVFKVLKAGKLCDEIQTGDLVTITPGIRKAEKILDGKTYFLVYEQQIDGYSRVTKDE